MDVYDRAYALARAIRDSEARQRFLLAKQKVASDPAARGMLEDYQKYLKTLQDKILAGEEISEAENEKEKNSRKFYS